MARAEITERDKAILRGIANEKTDKEMAIELKCSHGTIRRILSLLYAKLGVKGRAGLIYIAMQKNLIK